MSVNLVQNAAESIAGAGKVTLREGRDRLTLGGRASDVVILEIEDNGRGIPPEMQKPFIGVGDT
jgi:signal transduction histidine kinase